MKDPAGNPAPSGGFKTGGWYGGYQYWNGSFAPTAGVIHPSSNQQGAGGQAYVAPKDQAFIAAEKARATPQSKEEVNPYLKDFQNNLFNSSQSPETRIPTAEEIKAQTAPSTPYPEPLKRVEKLDSLRTSYGITDLETRLNDLKAQEDEAIAALRIQTKTEEGKPVPLGVISGRVTEEERQARENLDFIGRQKSRVTDELNTKYNVINQVMTLEGLDYNDAVNRYESEFDRNLKIYDLISDARKEAKDDLRDDRNAARANLQIYANAAISGNIDYDSLGPEQKLMIQKLEVQSGLPVGLISSIKKDPKADIIFTSTNNGITQVGFRNSDGSIKVESYGTSTAGGSGDWRIEAPGSTFGNQGGSKNISDLWNQA